MRFYLQLVTELGIDGHDPRHVLAYILTGHPTLGHLSRDDFRAEIAIAKGCIAEGGTERAERCAASWGL